MVKKSEWILKYFRVWKETVAIQGRQYTIPKDFDYSTDGDFASFTAMYYV